MPAKQFMKTGDGVYDNLVDEIENVKTKVIKYDYMLFEKRPVEEIYTVVDLSEDPRYEAWFNGDDGISGATGGDVFSGLFSFDKYAWSKGATIGNTTLNMVKNMPFTIFKIMPAYALSTDAIEQMRAAYIQILTAINRTQANITKDDLITKTAGQIQNMFPPNSLTTNDVAAINKFKELQDKAYGTIAARTMGHVMGYFETSDTENTRKSDKVYYKKISSTIVVDEEEMPYDVYTRYSGQIPPKPGMAGYNEMTYFPVYEYGYI